MKKFSVDLIEENHAYYFSIDSIDKKEYNVKKKQAFYNENSTTNGSATPMN